MRQVCVRCHRSRPAESFPDPHRQMCAYCINKMNKSKKAQQLTIYDVLEPEENRVKTPREKRNERR